MKINLLFPIIVGFMLWCGFTDRVDWWVIAVILVNDLAIELDLGKLRSG